jgi:predicted AAA+ superfamily ATPase
MTYIVSEKGVMEQAWVERQLDIHNLLEKRSCWLLGPRQTGKTSLIRRLLPDIRYYDLLDSATYLALSRRPGQLAEEIGSSLKRVVIDEIQRLPSLLNEVHRLIETQDVHFLLTGSSARKLRRGGVNLLGGRARVNYLHPLTYRELGDQFDLYRAMKRGMLPSIYFSDDPKADLQAYAGLYLQQEIMAEGATRNIPAFSRFLKIAAHSNGGIVNFTNIASDAQVARTTVYEYYDILKDTLILRELPPWRRTVKRKPLASSKYYFFDVGVVSALQGRPFLPGTPEFGEAFETFLMHELACRSDYVSGAPLSFWRSTSGFEVDFIIGDHTAVEAKAKENVSPQDLKSLRALREENICQRYLFVCMEPRSREVNGIRIIPFGEFLSALWAGEFN